MNVLEIMHTLAVPVFDVTEAAKLRTLTGENVRVEQSIAFHRVSLRVAQVAAD